MKSIDIEKLKKEQKTLKEVTEYRRSLAVLLFVSKGDMSLSGFTLDHAKRLKRQYMRDGVSAFTDKRRSNRDRVLSKKERELIIKEIKNNTPDSLIPGCVDTLWTTYLLGEYIHTITKKRYKSKTSAYLLFKEAKLSWHKPGKVYDKADPVRQEEWKKDTKLLLQKHWDNPNTIILCEDEMVLTIQSTLQKVWLPQGKYPPVIETTGTRKNKSFYGFLSLKTGREHTFITDYQNMYITRSNLTQMRIFYPEKHLLILWDNAGWHRGSQVMEWIQKDENTEIIWFPSYSPDLNPQEHIWKAGRKAITHNKHITNIQQTAEEFKTYLEANTFPYELLGYRAAG